MEILEKLCFLLGARSSGSFYLTFASSGNGKKIEVVGNI